MCLETPDSDGDDMITDVHHLRITKISKFIFYRAPVLTVHKNVKLTTGIVRIGLFQFTFSTSVHFYYILYEEKLHHQQPPRRPSSKLYFLLEFSPPIPYGPNCTSFFKRTFSFWEIQFPCPISKQFPRQKYWNKKYIASSESFRFSPLPFYPSHDYTIIQ